MKIVTIEQMASLERASDKTGVSVDVLMRKAGLAVANHVIQQFPSPLRDKVLVLVGPGNNGADGLIAASYLHQHGIQVQIYACTAMEKDNVNMTLINGNAIPISKITNDPNLELLRRHLSSSSIVIDAILGTGNNRPIQGQLRHILQQVTNARKKGAQLLAIDLPTGLNADTGAVDPSCPGADTTIALGYPKIGHFTFPGASVRGKLKIVDIGIPSGLDEKISLELITQKTACSLIPPRPLDAHKGTFGRLIVIGGSRNYVGAPILSCLGAYRIGTGLVALATPQSVYTIAAGQLNEATYVPLSETETGSISSVSVNQTRKILPQYTAMVIGCGLGKELETAHFVQELLLHQTIPNQMPVVVDADALNTLAQIPKWHSHLKNPAVLTPHPAEMARLIGIPTSEVQVQRLNIVRHAAQQWNKVIVLKGAFTAIASPDGTVRLNPFANPGLASAGTGDILSGIIGGLLAQGLSPINSATLGVYLHGAAAEEVRNSLGDSGMLASDLLPELPRRIKALRQIN
jgi:hydroxyethylthiazole kinase-like uncharacterized protein yjeF